MTTGTWDVIIVGARCAGATLATLLARKGVRALLLEAGPRGTNLPLSTHYVQPAGMTVLDRIGVGQRVRAVTPASKRFRAALDGVDVITPAREDASGYCVRRSTIDPWLQDTAEGAGADFRDRHRVVDLVRDGERVTGVVVERAGGRETFSARLVVGADGVHSTLAKLTGAETYLTEEATRGGYFLYYPAPTKWEQPWDATLEHIGDEVRYVFRCDGDQLVLIALPSLAVASTWGARWKERAIEMLKRSPTTAPLCEGKEPVGKGAGLLQTTYFYRRPIGPGFALVGDAGHYKDYVTGMGMTDAFLDAERLAVAILDGREAAFERFWRDRDVATLPLHYDALRQGKVGYNSAINRWVFERLGADEALHERLLDVFTRRMRPYDMIPMKTMLGWMGAALLRGRLDVLAGFAQMGKVIGSEMKELAMREALLVSAERALAAAPRPAATAVAA